MGRPSVGTGRPGSATILMGSGSSRRGATIQASAGAERSSTTGCYNRPINPHFQVQVGVWVNPDSVRAERRWVSRELSPGFCNVEATVYVSDIGHNALRTNASYDLYLTHRLVLRPPSVGGDMLRKSRPRRGGQAVRYR